MNKLTITILITGLGLLTGCNKWLDVKPEGQSTRDQMFQTQKGFRDALTGAYLDLKSGDAYGHALTWGTIEYLARNWDVIATSNTTLNNLVAANYNDAGVKERDSVHLCKRIQDHRGCEQHPGVHRWKEEYFPGR